MKRQGKGILKIILPLELVQAYQGVKMRPGFLLTAENYSVK